MVCSSGALSLSPRRSDAGLVNVYRSSDAAPVASPAESLVAPGVMAPAFETTAPLRPVKVFENLTTRIHGIKYHPSGEALTFWSHALRDQLRVGHTGSWTVFPNWPTARSPLRYVSSVDFSPEGGFVALGNDRGRVLLYRMTHFSDL